MNTEPLPKLADLVDMDNPQAVIAEVKTIATSMEGSFNFSPVDRVCADIIRLFRGEYPGFRACNTQYHDLKHTLEVLLALARLMHGAFLKGFPFSERAITIGLISALMHDTGYIQAQEDQTGTGAKYTLSHIQRSIDFVKAYCAHHDVFKDEQDNFRDIMNCTGLNTKVSEIRFASKEMELLGKILGTADLLGQMSDRFYLEKLLYLFYEFKEARIDGFNSEWDLLCKTPGFYQITQRRFDLELGRVYLYAAPHFRERWQIDHDLYQAAVRDTITYLHLLLKNGAASYESYLKRGGLVKKLRTAVKDKVLD